MDLHKLKTFPPIKACLRNRLRKSVKIHAIQYESKHFNLVNPDEHFNARHLKIEGSMTPPPPNKR
jgi:hypothetical protein